MGKLEHTPGPWVADVNRHRILIQSVTGFTITRVQLGYVGEPAYARHIDARLANAHLIAKAPDMLEAPQAFVDVSTEEERRLAFNKATAVLSSLRARDGGEGL